MPTSLESRRFLAATLTRFDSAEGSSAFTNEFVRMDLGDFKVDIDTRYGGTPSRWFNGFDPNSVTNPFAGEGVTVMWDQGNDPTQGSASGPGVNPIARLDGQQLSFNYYARETLFDAGGGNSATVAYEVTGFAPYFWISHEAGDDAIPSESLPRWRTLWNNPGDSSQILSDPTVPIFYKAGGTPDGAVMFIGDDVVVANTSWSQRLAETREGRFAAKVRVSLKNASSDAIAGLMFRRQIADAVDVSEAAAYSSPGYTLNVNSQGTLEIVRIASQGASPVSVWTSAPNVAASTINSTAGALLELRTDNANGNVEIFLNGSSIGNYNDPQVLRGAHFGLFAQSSTGEIKFSDRQVFDVGTEYVARYTGHENGVLTSDIQIRNVAGVSTPSQIYFAQTPSVWLGNAFRSDAIAQLLDSSGNIIQEFSNGAVASQILRGDDGDASTQEPYALWLGATANRKGIFGVPQAAWVNGVPAGSPHAQIDVNNQGRYVVSMNPLPRYPAWPPTSQDVRNAVTSLRMITDWRPKLETIAPLLVSIGDLTITEGDSSQKLATFTVALNRMPTQIVTIKYATSSSTAIAGADFIAKTGTLVFDPADGLLSKTISVPIVGDTLVESNESFKLSLSAPKNAAIGDGEAIATIVNDDTPPTTQYIDDGDLGFSASGVFEGTAARGRLNDIRFIGNGQASATRFVRWQFAINNPGQYRVMTTWTTAGTNASDANYRVLTGIGGTQLGQAFLNQQLAPNDLIDANDIASPNSAWEQISIVNVSGATLLVELSNQANGKVYADSVRIERIGDLPVGVTVVSNATVLPHNSVVSIGSTTAGVSVDRIFTILNTTAVSLIFQPLALTGAGYSIRKNIPANTVLAPGERLTIKIRFNRSVAGSYAGSLSINVYDPRPGANQHIINLLTTI